MTRSVTAAARAFDILELFLDDPTPRSSSEIARLLELPRTTVHELVHTLLDRSYLRRADDRSFQLGVKVFELGNAFGATLEISREARHAARAVVDQCNETVHVAVREGTEVLYVAKVDSTHSVRMVSGVGRRLPAHLTAVGKMLLSDLTDGELDELYSSEDLEGWTPTSIRTLTALKERVAKIRADQLAWDDRESNPDVFCVAAPVYDHTHRMTAAMSISVPAVRWSDDRALELADVVTAGALELTMQLGGGRQSA